MGTRTEFAPGTFSWVDLTTSDAAGAKQFYGGLLGWEFDDNDIPGGAGGPAVTRSRGSACRKRFSVQ